MDYKKGVANCLYTKKDEEASYLTPNATVNPDECKFYRKIK